MRDFPPGADDGWPYTWAECQEYMERPRMRLESDSAWWSRVKLAELSAAIRASLQEERNRQDSRDRRP